MALTEITYTDKETLNEQPSIAAKNKVTDDDMNEIKSVVNTNASKVGDLDNLNTSTTSSIVGALNEINSKSVYESTEQVVGEWTDGQPIYRLIITGTKVSGTNFVYQLSNIGKVISLNGVIKVKANFVYNINRYESSSVYSYCAFSDNSQIRVVSSTGDWSNGELTIIIEYTKAS